MSMITPARCDITIYTGATYELQVQLQDAAEDPIDLTNRAIAAQIWNTRGTTQVVPFTVTKTDIPAGTILLSLTAEQTALLPVNRSVGTVAEAVVGSWDLRVTEPDGTTVFYWLEGTVSTNVGVTSDV